MWKIAQVDQLMSDLADVFPSGKHDLGRTNMTYHRVTTGDAQPIRHFPRRMPLHCCDEMTKLVDDMQQQGIIQPLQSPWASPVVLVQKKDSSTRFCVDYRRLNKITKKDCYPLPRVDDILDTLAEVQWFSTIDVATGKWKYSQRTVRRRAS